MLYLLLADLVMAAHFGFVVFVLFGGLLVLRYPGLLPLHLVALSWGVVVQWANWICPLTPLENLLRQRGGEAGYGGGFIEHLLMPLLYPENLTVELRHALALLLILVNLGVYGLMLWRRLRD